MIFSDIKILVTTGSYWTGTSNILRRYALRIGGFVSVYAPMNGGEIIIKIISFEGSKL